jgi:hypothetical protein
MSILIAGAPAAEAHMMWRRRCLSVIAGTMAGAFGAGTADACGEVVEFLPGGEVKSLEFYDAMPPFARFELASLSKPSEKVSAFLRFVHGTYLPKSKLGVYGLSAADMAKLIGYAIGEAATNSDPLGVFTSGFRTELEAWIARLSVYGDFRSPGEGAESANNLWRLVEEGARGFHDEEIRSTLDAINGGPGPTSVAAWFKALSPPEQQQFLDRATKAGLVGMDGAPLTIAWFEALSVFMDGEFDREGLSDEDRRARIRDLAAGKFDTSIGE